MRAGHPACPTAILCSRRVHPISDCIAQKCGYHALPTVDIILTENFPILLLTLAIEPLRVANRENMEVPQGYFEQLFERPPYFRIPTVRLLDTLLWEGPPHGIFAFSSRSACFWIGVGDEEASNPGFPCPDGSIRFVLRVPSCRSSPRKSRTAIPDRVRLVATCRRARRRERLPEGRRGSSRPSPGKLGDFGQGALLDLAALAVGPSKQRQNRTELPTKPLPSGN